MSQNTLNNFFISSGVFQIRFPNGFFVSMANRPRNYTDARDMNVSLEKIAATPCHRSRSIEVAVIDPHGRFVTPQFTEDAECPPGHFEEGAWVENHGGVAGWQTPEEVLEILNRVSQARVPV